MFIKKAFILTAIALGLAIGPANANSPYGLTARNPIGPFLNSNLPSAVTDGSGGWMTVAAFPYLTFEDPTYLLAAPGTNRLYVCCRQGSIWYFQNDPNTTNKSMFLDLTGRNQGWDDCGVLGMAFHPEFGQAGSTNRGFVYVYYQYTLNPINPNVTSLSRTTPTYNRLSRFTVPDGAIAADPSSELVLINQFDQDIEHNGGAMFFGPDGFLYVSNGDEGGSDDMFGTAQKINSGLFSGVLRIDVNQNPATSHPIRRQPLSGVAPPGGWPQTFTANYYIPNDNPFVNPNGSVLEEFFALGFRSPHRMTLDPPTGRIWLGDVGDSAREEVDLIVKGGNYQWDYQEGLNFNGPTGKPAVLIGTDSPPIYDYPHQNGDSCVIGGYVYRGALHSELWGLYIFGDNYSGRIWSMAYDGTNAPVVTYLCNMPPGIGYSGLSSFGLDQNNELYMCQMGSAGQIWKLARSGPASVQPPSQLSQLGVFTNLTTLAPAAGLVPYDVNCPLWSDGAVKSRWMAVPNDGTPFSTNEQIGFAPTGEWTFPIGTVFVKHFELSVDDTNPNIRKRLETRVLAHGSNGSYYGLTYKWRADNSDADLLTSSLSENIVITTATGTRTQTWYYPSQQDCLICHNPNANYVLGAKTRQLNGNFTYPSTGTNDNQLRTLNSIGLFNPPLNETDILSYTSLFSLTNSSASLETRARSYIDANCAQCHRPNSGVQAAFDARFDTPLANQGITNGLVLSDLGITGAVVVAPGDLTHSIMYLRMNSIGAYQMPPLARNTIDSNAVATMAAWITGLGAAGTTNPPTITSQPLGLTVNQGANAQFNVTANGTAPLTYQWKFNGNSILNATSTSYVVVNVQATNAGNYFVTVSNPAGSTNSASAALGVNLSPIINAQPQALVVNQGASAQFSVTASGAAPLSYQWQLNGTSIGGATQSSFAIANVQPTNAGNYSVTVSNVAGSTTSSTASLTVNVPPSITTAPQSISVSQGASAQFNITATGSGTLTYQWKFNSTNIANATASAFTLANAQPTNAGNYSVTIANSVGSTNSPNAVLTVNAAPAINVPPQSLAVIQGATALFTVTATGASPLSYQWKFNGNNIAGAIGSSYTIDSAQPTNVGNYSVTITNIVGSTNSGNAVLTVNIPPNITTQPQAVAVNQGSGTQFTVSATGTAPLSYQWALNGTGIANATASTFIIANAQLTNAGNYTVVVTNVAGRMTSVAATLTVNALPSINTAPQSLSVNQGASAQFSVTATGSGLLAYQWKFNGSGILGATSSSYIVNNAQPANAGNYSVIVTNVAGSTNSGNAILTVNVPPGIMTQPQSITVNQGASAQFVVAASGTSPLSYQWQLNGINLPGATSTSLLIASAQATNAGIYSVVVTNVAGRLMSSNATLNVNSPPVITTQPQNVSAGLGGLAVLSVGTIGTAPLAYQWQYNGANITGASLSTLVLTNLQFTNAGNYAVVVSNALGTVKSANAVIIVLPATIPSPAGLVNWWPGDGNANDIQGTNNAILLNGTTFTTGEVGQAFNFDGVTNEVSVGAIYPSLTNSFTIMMWAKPTAAMTISGQSTSGTAGLTGQRYAIFPRHGTSAYGANHTGSGISIGTNGVSVFEHADNLLASPLVYNGSINGWTHIVVVYQNGQPQLYVNGALKQTGLKSPYNVHPSAEMGGPYGFYKGATDEVGVYNRALSAPEIQSIYNAGTQGMCKGGQITGITWLHGGVLQIGLKDRTGGNFRIDVSTNLANWTPLATITNSPGVGVFSDPSATNANRRFYRQVALP